MKLPRPHSLRQRLLLISTAVTLATLLIASIVFVAYDVRTMRSQMIRDLGVLAEVVGENCVSALVFDVPRTAEENLASLRREYQIRYAILYDAEGQRFAHYSRDGHQLLEDPMWGGEGASLEPSVFGLGGVSVTRELSLKGQPVGRIFIRAEMEELRAQLMRDAGVVALLSIVALAVSLLLAFRLQRQVSEPIRGLAERTRDIAERADYSLRASPPAVKDEIADLVEAFNNMLVQIETRDRQLQEIGAHLERANAQLRGMAMQLSLVGEREKKRLAGELHDSPMQKLALAQAQIASAARQRDSESEELLEVGLTLVREALQELRTLQFDLSPPVLHQEGLAAALEWLASNTSDRFGLSITFIKKKPMIIVGKELGLVLFQCARELVNNVVKHANATHVTIELDATGRAVDLLVRDNGRGLVRQPVGVHPGNEGGYGLYSVRERVSLLGGEFLVRSDSAGTSASVRVPQVSGPSDS